MSFSFGGAVPLRGDAEPETLEPLREGLASLELGADDRPDTTENRGTGVSELRLVPAGEVDLEAEALVGRDRWFFASAAGGDL